MIAEVPPAARQVERPLVVWMKRDTLLPVTIVAMVVLAGAAALRIVGLPPVDLHGPLHYIGIMDPFCGGTRATYLLASGDFGRAALYNPIVFPMAISVAVFAVRAVIGWTTGRWLTVLLPRNAKVAGTVLVVAALLALWVRQQLLADLMMQPWTG